MTQNTEAARVQIPALVHLTRLGYKYVRRMHEQDAGVKYDPDTNILLSVFKEQFAKLNPEATKGKMEEVLVEIRQKLDNDDLGRSFYEKLTTVSPIKLIDFERPENNEFHCTAEFTCGPESGNNFRPDITLFINGLPLVFIEVKKPNNRAGIVAERDRINRRFTNKKFRSYINITQLMIFSNNMEYDAEGGVVPILGAFYCTAAREKASFNCFREENPRNSGIAPFIENYPYRDIDDATEREILSDFNYQVIHSTQEYRTNLEINTPTNRILTSMCSPRRLLFLLRYGIAYVRSQKEVDGEIEFKDEKHIMRYQQMFAALAIRKKLSEGVKSGVVWHTQGSGKTALAFYLNYILSDFYTKHDKVAKFYFIVDRLDLLNQAREEFEARGLTVKTANSRTELMDQFKITQSQEGDTGEKEVTVANIQRFKEDPKKVNLPPYATNLQRIFIIDEAHRGYKPEGSFLANLFEADPNSIKIALTGTPLLKEERASWKVFGEYLHTYYYDRSIQDGYTLKIIREDIETSYRANLSAIYKELESLLQKGVIKKKDIIEHDKYVAELLRYIITDLKKFRKIRDDETAGGMVICATSKQAEKLSAAFDKIQSELNETDSSLQSNFKAGLVLFDTADNETTVHNFKKKMTVDVLIVYNMLLTGFDAPRLKRLYFGRELDNHGLLQAITRVNRPYKDYRFGYVIDFVDIKRNFDETNEAYLRELDRFNDSETERPPLSGQVLMSTEEILKRMHEIRQELFAYTMDNFETFQKEMSETEDKQTLLNLRKLLEEARDYYNIVRVRGDEKLKAEYARVNIQKLPQMLGEVQRRINIINKKEAFDKDDSTRELLNEAMLGITFSFKRIRREELKVISGGVELQEKWTRVRRELDENIDKKDPQYVTLWEAFIQRFREHGFEVQNLNEYKEHLKFLDELIEKLKSLKIKNIALLKKYSEDAKFVRVHKRIREKNDNPDRSSPIISKYDEKILEVLSSIKSSVDQEVYYRGDILKKDPYFKQTVMGLVTNGLDKLSIVCSSGDRKFIRDKITEEYINQYNEFYKNL